MRDWLQTSFLQISDNRSASYKKISIFTQITFMKKNLTILLLCLLCFLCFHSFGQSTAGLIAHWDMNGSSSDVSGNGHVSHAIAVTPTTGRDGFPNTAYYFNGVNSMISTPSAPDLSLTHYSICAIVKVLGFWTGLCQANFIVSRGPLQTPGAYTLQFNDNPNDGNDCSALDSTKEVFQANAGATGSGGAGIAMWSYTPTIARNTWYKVVATWDGTKYQIFINDTLKTSLTSITGGVFGTGTDSLAIGLSPWGGSTYPWPFKGVIDDIKIYNRVLNDTEIRHYGDTCGSITSQPVTANTSIDGVATFSVSTTIMSPTYQWQQDAGTGFVNLTNSGPYSGVNTNTLHIAGVTATMNGDRYRCLISNSWCGDTTTSALLSTHVGVGIHTQSEVVVYPNPGHDMVWIKFVGQEPGVVQLINNLGQVLLQQLISSGNNKIDIAELPCGSYILKFQSGDDLFFKRFIKN